MIGHPYRHSEPPEPPGDRDSPSARTVVFASALVLAPSLYVCLDAMLVRTTVDNVRIALFVLATLFGVLVGVLIRRVPWAVATDFVVSLIALRAYEWWILEQTVWDDLSLPALAALSALMALIAGVLRGARAAAIPPSGELPIEAVPESHRRLVSTIRRRRERLARAA